MLIGLRSLLRQAVNTAGLAKSVDAAGVCDLWPKIISEKFGKNFANKCEAIKFQNGILSVRTASSVFSQELELEKTGIIDLINRKLEKNIVKRIKFEI